MQVRNLYTIRTLIDCCYDCYSGHNCLYICLTVSLSRFPSLSLSVCVFSVPLLFGPFSGNVCLMLAIESCVSVYFIIFFFRIFPELVYGIRIARILLLCCCSASFDYFVWLTSSCLVTTSISILMANIVVMSFQPALFCPTLPLVQAVKRLYCLVCECI